MLADLLLQPVSEMAPEPFRPTDLSSARLKTLKIAPPIEVVIKRMHSGTSKHRYYGMSGCQVRHSHPLFRDILIEADGAYPCPIVRFDWRNPLQDNAGKNLADEILPDAVADWFIDTNKARITALRVYDALADFLASRDIVNYDLCSIIS